MITAEQHKALRERIAIESAWWDRPKEDDEKLMPEDMRVSNEDRSAVEVYEFVNDPPERYTVYINTRECTATTWTGDVLGTVTFGKEYRSNMGDKRQHVWMKGINGKVYTGTSVIRTRWNVPACINDRLNNKRIKLCHE
jgi:uncharacterized secreted protein with C-terminal beta-propeller domain